MARTIPRCTKATGYMSMATDLTLAADFTITFDAWSENSDVRIVLGDESAGSGFIASLGNALTINIGGSSRSTPAGTFIKGVLHAVQIVRVGSTITLTIDGTDQLVTSSSSSITFNRIGRYNSGLFGWDGYIKDMFIIDDTTGSNSRSWALDEPTAGTEDSTQGGNAVTFVGSADTERNVFNEVGSNVSWWSDEGAVLETIEEQNTSLIFEIGQSNSLGLGVFQAGTDDQYAQLTGRIRQFGFSRQVREGANNPLSCSGHLCNCRNHGRSHCI